MIKKILASVVLVFTLISSNIYAIAEESPSSTPIVVEDEQTPEAARWSRYNYQFLVIMVAMQAVLVVILYKFYQDKHKSVKLNISGIEANGDGSYLVKWGYVNPKKKGVIPEKASLNVKRGSAILLKKNEGKEMKPGRHDDVMVTVVNKDTSLEWIVDDQRLVIDGKDIKKKKGENI